jgi:hypothetical protein
MNNPRAARTDPALATAAPVVTIGILLEVGPTGVAVALDPGEPPPVAEVLLDEGSDPDPVPVARMSEGDAALDAGATEVLDNCLTEALELG